MQKLSSQTEHISSLEKLLQKPEKQVEYEKIIQNLENEFKLQLEEKNKQAEYLIMQVSMMKFMKFRSPFIFYKVVLIPKIFYQLDEYGPLQEKIRSLENELENAKSDVTNAHELQAAVESNKVAASQAIAQNAKLKEELVRLNACVDELVCFILYCKNFTKKL